VVVPDGTKTWETYILAAQFKRQEAEETASKGGGGFMFRNFMCSAYRCADLDDALLWTLHKQGLMEEYRLGGGERTIAKGYNELWTLFAKKYRELAREVGRPPGAEVVADSPSDARSKAKAKAKAKMKSAAKEQDEEASKLRKEQSKIFQAGTKDRNLAIKVLRSAKGVGAAGNGSV